MCRWRISETYLYQCQEINLRSGGKVNYVLKKDKVLCWKKVISCILMINTTLGYPMNSVRRPLCSDIHFALNTIQGFAGSTILLQKLINSSISNYVVRQHGFVTFQSRRCFSFQWNYTQVPPLLSGPKNLLECLAKDQKHTSSIFHAFNP